MNEQLCLEEFLVLRTQRVNLERATLRRQYEPIPEPVAACLQRQALKNKKLNQRLSRNPYTSHLLHRDIREKPYVTKELQRGPIP